MAIGSERSGGEAEILYHPAGSTRRVLSVHVEAADFVFLVVTLVF